MKKKINFNYSNRVILKPWGEEYVIYSDKKKLAITYLKIKKNSSTSLHCHPQKKTGFLILKGTAEVQVGIYKENTKKYKPLSIFILKFSHVNFHPSSLNSIKILLLSCVFINFTPGSR